MTTRGRRRRRTAAILRRFSRVFSTLPSGRSRASRWLTLRMRAASSASAWRIVGGASGAGLALREVEDAGAPARALHGEEGAAAGLLDVVAMCGDGEDVDC